MSDNNSLGASDATRRQPALSASPTEPLRVSSLPGNDQAQGWRDGADLEGVKWPLGGYAPGNYMGRCATCKEQVVGIDKRAKQCLRCAINSITAPAPVALQSIDEVRAEISRQIDWYEKRGREMKTREYALAFAVVIGATKALREVLDKMPPSAPNLSEEK